MSTVIVLLAMWPAFLALAALACSLLFIAVAPLLVLLASYGVSMLAIHAWCAATDAWRSLSDRVKLRWRQWRQKAADRAL